MAYGVVVTRDPGGRGRTSVSGAAMAYYSVARRYGSASQHPSEYWTVTYHLILFASVSASAFPVVSS